MKREVAVFLSAALLFWGSGCTPEGGGPSVGTKTNWLLSCAADADCGGLACLCGVCTQACADQTDCAQLGGVCTSDLPRIVDQAQCGDSSSALCLARCDGAADCQTGFACVAGACVSAPAPLACPADSLLCSSFEDPQLPEFSITAPPAGTLEATSALAFSGKRALLASTPGATSRTRLVASFDARRSGTLFLRFWLFVPGATVLNDVHSLTVGDVDHPDWGVNLHLLADHFSVGTPTGSFAGDLAVPRNRWLCVEEDITLGDLDGSVTVRVDGATALVQSSIDTLPAAGAHDMTVGIDDGEQSEPAEIHVDDVLLSDTRAGCF